MAFFRRRAQRDLPFEQHATDYCVGAETAGFGAPFYIKTIILPSRLGTTMGEALKNRLLSVGLEGAGELRARIHRPVSCGAKNASF